MTFDDRGDPGAPARPGFVSLEGRLIDETGAPPTGGAPILILHPWVEVFPAGSDVFLLRTGGEPTVAIRDPEPEDRRLLEHLAAGGGVTGDSTEAKRLEPLCGAGLVIERVVNPLRTAAGRFDRQLPYLAAFTDPDAAMDRLRRSHVCVIGCGGLGTWALAAMASMGVGAFTLVDDDVVDITNLNRQVLYTVADLGEPKVERAAAWISRFDPEVRITTYQRRVASSEDAAQVVGRADVAVLAADWPPYELGRWVNAACLAEGIPFVTAAQQPPVLRVGPTYMPGSGACFACHERQVAESFPLFPLLAEYRRSHPTTATTLGPASGIVGSLLGLEMLHLLAAGPDLLATRGRAMLLDMRTLDVRWESIQRHEDCDVCG